MVWSLTKQNVGILNSYIIKEPEQAHVPPRFRISKTSFNRLLEYVLFK